MNKIEAKMIHSFGKDILSIHIDNTPIDQLLYKRTSNSSLENLWCAWLLNNTDNDANYIWTLLNEKRNCNIPILLCPDDMDFWCTVVVAKVQFFEDSVVWHKVGFVSATIDHAKWCKSGIQNIDSWSGDDWNKYGDTLATLHEKDPTWEQWWSLNWNDEENRRIWNYFDPYFNNDENITWLNCPSFSFHLNEYNTCIEMFKTSQY